MATSYIIATFDESQLPTRSEFITKCQSIGVELIVSADNKSLNKTIHDDGINIGCRVNGICWVSFNSSNIFSDITTYIDTYNGGAAYSLAESLGINIVSEHDSDFPKYQFGLDITKTNPTKVIGDWSFYVDSDNWILPYNHQRNLYFSHLVEQYTEDFDWEEYISLLDSEC